jgi:hypothetical protein
MATTTRSVPAQGLSVTTTATMADAQLIASLLTTPLSVHAAAGADFLMSRRSPMSYAQYEREHPPGSDHRRDINAMMGFNETIATFVKRGLLDRELVEDLYWVAGAWRACENIVRGIREQAGEPRLYENFEALAQQQP